MNVSEARRADTFLHPPIMPRLRRSIIWLVLDPRPDGRGYFMAALRAFSRV
jgi:hypothetical protein